MNAFRGRMYFGVLLCRDRGYAAFGRVTEGMETADAIVAEKTDWQDRPRKKQVMKTVTVDTFGVDYPEPEKF